MVPTVAKFLNANVGHGATFLLPGLTDFYSSDWTNSQGSEALRDFWLQSDVRYSFDVLVCSVYKLENGQN